MSGTENAVGVAPDGSGKKVRVLEVTTYVNGVETTVEMQVVALADELGKPISFGGQLEALQAIQQEMRLHTDVLLRMLRAIDVQQEISRDELLELITEGEDPT